MALTYLDQNALIALGKRARQPGFRKTLDAALESRSLTAVVSPWHLIETAHSTRLPPALELAEFIDSMRPMWLFERHDVLRLEVAEDFYRFACVNFSPTPRVATRSAVIAALSRKPDSPRFDIASARFVKQWWERQEQLLPLETPYKQNADSLIRLRELKKEGKLTDEVRTRANRELLKHTVPKATPAGVIIGYELRQAYIAQAAVDSIPTFAIENAISEHEWDAQGGADRNTLIDKFHLISALPYVDEIVSSDGFFRQVYPVAFATGHVRAGLLSNEEFLKRLVPS